MSFQYVHTSAKRGLEPGKSGFCCVARDRNLPPDLVSELESQSRYTADINGASPLVLRHRIVTLRSGTYNILSHIQESGTDYSKRNNHLAHHLAFPQDEIPGLPNPAAILLNWRGWRDKWNEPPRVLEPFEAFDLQDIESFWATQKLPDTFRSVIQGAASHGQVFKISLTQERLLVEHLRRAINDLPTHQRWVHPFTSCLLPTDQPQDYPWAGQIATLPLPYDLDLITHPTPKFPPPKAVSQATLPSEPSEPNEEAEAKPKKFKAPVVEIPADFDRKKLKRPKRHFGKSEASKAINIAVVGAALVCLALILYFVQFHRSSDLVQTHLESRRGAEQALQARKAIWQAFADAGYPRSELANARATANALATIGEDTPLQTIAFLDRLLDLSADEEQRGIPVPKHLLQEGPEAKILPLSPIGYPALARLCLIPAEVLRELDFPKLEHGPAPLASMPQKLFTPQALATSLDSYLLQADAAYHSLPPATLLALESYFEQREQILANPQFAPVLGLTQIFGLPDEAAYIPFDERGRLLPGTPMSLAQYLRELLSQHVERSDDPALQSNSFQALLGAIQGEKQATPAATANGLYQALAFLDLENRSPNDPWRKIRQHWRSAFTHPDLMEQTIIGYSLDALEAAKARLAHTQNQFNQADLALHLASKARAAQADAAKRAAIEALASKEWIVIGKQSAKVPNTSP